MAAKTKTPKKKAAKKAAKKKLSKDAREKAKVLRQLKKKPKPEEMLGTPIWFAREILGLKLYPWQEKVLWDVAIGKKPVALRAANGSGKTACVALPLVLWHATVFPFSQTVTTAGVYRQVKEQLWGGIRSVKEKLGKGWQINATDLMAPNGSRAIGFSTDDPGKFEGWHNKNLMMIFDEAKSVPDEIFAAHERCQATRTLLMSSAGTTEGEFAAAFSTRGRFYSTHTVTSYDCPHLEPAWIDMMIDKWGRDHPLVRSMIFSEFIDTGGSAFVVPPHHWDACLSEPPTFTPGSKLAFIDWAAGGDENVLAIVDGNKALPPICWRDQDTMAAAGRAAGLLLEHDVPRSRVYADDGGLGHPINDAMEQGGFPIRRVLNNTKPSNRDHYLNLGAELWYTAARLVEKKEVVLPDDDTLRQQATTRKRIFSPTGKLALEKKDDLRARGMTSPDRADAVLSALAIASTVGNQYSDTVDQSVFLDDPVSDRQLQHAEQEFEGCFAGF